MMTSRTRRRMATTMMTLCRLHPVVVSTVLTALVIYVSLCPPTTSAGNAPRLGCRVRQFLKYTASKPGCRPQNIVLDGCFGRCDTYEIPELEFPFKSSHHVMCSYHRVDLVAIELDDCDPGVNRTFVYKNARSCRCRKCTPHNTFCFGLTL